MPVSMVTTSYVMQPIVNKRKDHSIYIIQFSEPKRARK